MDIYTKCQYYRNGSCMTIDTIKNTCLMQQTCEESITDRSEQIAQIFLPENNY